MTTANRYYDLQRMIDAAEEEKRKAAEAERIRQAVENANRQKIADADRQLAELKRQAAEEGLQLALENAHAAARLNRAAVDDLQHALAEAITDLLASLAGPLQAAERAYENTRTANDTALQAGMDLSYYAPPPPSYGPTGAPVNAEAEHQRAALMNSYGKARGALPAPYAPDLAALIGMSHETDPQRRRAWAALHHLITGGELINATSRYDAEQDARRRESARTQPRRLL